MNNIIHGNIVRAQLQAVKCEGVLKAHAIQWMFSPDHPVIFKLITGELIARNNVSLQTDPLNFRPMHCMVLMCVCVYINHPTRGSAVPHSQLMSN